MMNIVRALSLSTATLASIPVSAVEQEKDSCVLEGGSTEKVADCHKLPTMRGVVAKKSGFEDPEGRP